jgi:hypothetical protein
MKTLTYEGIRTDLVASLKRNPVFKDYNFDASGISALVNFLAYNSHRFGYMAKMLLDESFIDSAHSLPAMLSHAKRLGYEPRGSHAAAASLVVTVVTPIDYASDIVDVPRGTTFKSSNGAQDTRIFTTLLPTVLSFSGADADGRIFTGDVLCHEGVLTSMTFDVNAISMTQVYEVDDPGVDVSTMRVYIQLPQSASEFRIERAASPSDVNPSAAVFYASVTRNSTVGIRLSEAFPAGTKCRIEYLQTNGATGNGARIFSFAKKTPRSSTELNNFTAVTCVTDSPSQGGADPQGVDELRRAIPEAWRRQHRAVTADDIASIIRENFGDVSTVNVWGGEEEARRQYGKKFICVVPRSARVLSLGGRREIARLLGEYGIPGDVLEFVDADQQLVDVVVTVKRLPTGATDEEIERAVLTVIDEEMGITSGTSVLDFSSYGISNAVKEAVPDVSQVFPSLTFYNEVSFRDTSAKVMEFGNEIHHPPQTSGIEVKLEKVSPTSYRVTPSTVGSVSLVTTPVVPELRVIRNQYFEVRSRKVKVVR